MPSKYWFCKRMLEKGCILHNPEKIEICEIELSENEICIYEHVEELEKALEKIKGVRTRK